MIKQETIDNVLNAAHIDEVVGAFVDLKKRGSSLTGLCPFHNEKTPSFHVSVSKGIYKCFGCGAGGDAIRFIMEHEKYSYPEAIRFLAKKYHIEIEETEQSAEELMIRDKRESLLIVTNWAGQYFSHTLWNIPEGQNIGLSYFKERGYREDVIRKFELGYALEAWSDLLEKSGREGHAEEYLLDTGLIIKNDKGRIYDRFRGRVVFPIHNLTGRILGFGARTLKSDDKSPKYVNSPESEIYHKSSVLYGLYFAKKAISTADKCYLVEGYADVISMHQAGIENVVSSSGTALTQGQIRLISRFTKNVTILFDGDAAGIKAAMRGTDMLLKEGLNVKVLLFPDGNDPDSYIRKHGSSRMQSYIQDHEEDFLFFKTRILLEDANNDPIKRAETIREVVESIALIPDEIKVSVFIRECSNLLDIEERVLLTELNKIRISERQKASREHGRESAPHPDTIPATATEPLPKDDLDEKVNTRVLQEKEFIRVLLNYGHSIADWESDKGLPLAPLLINSVTDMTFEDPVCADILAIYKTYIEVQNLPEDRIFTSHRDPKIAELAISFLSTKYTLSPNWNDDKRNIYVSEEKEHLEELVYTTVYRIRKRAIEQEMQAVRDELKSLKEEQETTILIAKYQRLKENLKRIGEKLGTIVLK